MAGSAEVWSAQARVMVRPFAAYRALGTEAPSTAVWLGRAALVLFVVAAFVSLTASGRLVVLHVLFASVAWAFAPILQSVALAAAVLVVASRREILRALCLYFAGHAPWLVFLVVVAALCPLLPSAMRSRAFVPGVFGAIVAVQIWSVVLTVACFRAGLGLGRIRAAVAALVFYAVYVGAIVGWYLALDNIQPQLR